MKKTILAISLSILCLIKFNAQNKTNFEGTVTYSISFEGSGLPPEALAMFKGSETVTYIKSDKFRVDMNMPMQSSSFIMDNKTKNIISLMDIMGKKYLIKMNESDIKKEQDTAPEIIIKYTEETKMIAGYKCKKAEITSKDSKSAAINVFYTEEIPTNDVKPIYKGLKGFPMEYSINQGGMEMQLTAKNISKEKVSDSKFEIPKEGYIVTTIEELQNAMMKEMGGQ
ncbi:MAG: DUF4412 domain-containing protein [Bacteroidetes bacterium]|nr:DUF4412 domain-containing protein [Bacteroidota bacterium]